MTTTTRINLSRAPMRLLARVLFFAMACLAMAGCAASVDDSQARACRAVLPALHQTGASITVQSVTAPATRSLRVDYRARELPGPERGHFVICSFAEAGLGLRRTEIVALRTERRALTGASLYFLKRFWIEEAESEQALPAPPPRAPLFGAGSAGLVQTVQHAASALPMIVLTGLLAASYALIYGLAGRILLLFGEFALLGAAATSFGVAAGEVNGLSSPLPLLAFGLVCALWCGLWTGMASVRGALLPVLNRPGHHVMIVSVGLAIFLSEAIRLAQGAGRRWLSPVWNEPLPLLQGPDYSATVTWSALMVALAAIIFASGLLAFMRRSAFGRAWRAASDDALAAALMGVDVNRLVAWSFTIAACLAAMTGFLLSVHIGGMGFSGGAVFGLKALVGAILGGIGSIGGALAGGLLLGVMEALWSAFMPLEWRDVFVFALLSVLLVLRPGGLFGYGALSPRQV